jgi:hypothetical protein
LLQLLYGLTKYAGLACLERLPQFRKSTNRGEKNLAWFSTLSARFST